MSRMTGLHRTQRRSISPGLLRDVLLIGMCLPAAALCAKYGGGSGTVESPFLIYTVADFSAVGNSPADWDKHFKLMRDIDLSGYDETNLTLIGRWVGLGSLDNQPFDGFFDGGGKSIRNFRYTDVHQEYIGLFQHVVGEIRNLELRDVKVVGAGFGTGALVGYLERGSVADCSVTNVSVSGDTCVGGLVGVVDASVSKCSSRGRVSGIRYVGGLVGQLGPGTIHRSYSKADVVGNENVGGLVGGTLRETAIVDSSYATGDVDGSLYVGGLAGQVVQGRVFRCYAAGAVTGKQGVVGGLVGGRKVLGQVIGSLWDIESSGQATSDGGVGMTTAEMKSESTYLAANWDFGNTWLICEGINYPVLTWQIPAGDLRCPDGVDFIDFIWFAKNWRHDDCANFNGFCDWADIDGSGDVGYPDLAIFAHTWLTGLD